MANDFSALDALITEIRTAIQGSSWAAAKSKIAEAEAVLMVLPKDVGDADTRSSYRESLEKLSKRIDEAKAEAQQESGSGGMAIAFAGSPEGV